MSLIKQHLLETMSDFHEAALRQYEEEQDQLYREEIERINNPRHYWFVITDKWEDYAYSEEEKNELIQYAKEDGLRYSCTKHIDGESY